MFYRSNDSTSGISMLGSGYSLSGKSVELGFEGRELKYPWKSGPTLVEPFINFIVLRVQ